MHNIIFATHHDTESEHFIEGHLVLVRALGGLGAAVGVLSVSERVMCGEWQHCKRGMQRQGVLAKHGAIRY